MSLHDIISDSNSDDSKITIIYKAQEAQLVEQKTEDFWVLSSTLNLGNLIDVLELENKLLLGRSDESHYEFDSHHL